MAHNNAKPYRHKTYSQGFTISKELIAETPGWRKKKTKEFIKKHPKPMDPVREAIEREVKLLR